MSVGVFFNDRLQQAPRMEVKEVAGEKMAIAKPVASRPTCSKFSSISQLLLLAGANDSDQINLVPAIRPKTFRLIKPSTMVMLKSHNPTPSDHHHRLESDQSLEGRRSVPMDGRKYGQKQLKGSEYPQGYYKCAHPDCPVPAYSVQNWVQDLYWKELDLPYPDMSNAMVHHGFYFAYHNTTVRPAVINAIKRAKELYGNIDVVVVGHSMGGAMAAICALDLTISGVATDIQVMTFGQPRIVMTFGQPRIGNSAFVAHYIQRVQRTIRVSFRNNEMISRVS